MIYMDNAATGMWMPKAAIDTMELAMRTSGNPGRGTHEPAMAAARFVFSARKAAASYFKAEDPSRIAFTMNATESLNLAIRGLIKEGDHVITSRAEHNSVLRPLYAMEKEGLISLSFLPLDSKGVIALDELKNLVRPETKAIVITHASNVTGNVTDLAVVSAFAKEHGLLLMVDASQTAGSLDIDVISMGIDCLCFTGHKGLHGPMGTGGVYVRKGLEPVPYISGGTGFMSFSHEQPSEMPACMEAGTPNVPGIAGLGAAIGYNAALDIKEKHHREMALEKNFVLRVCDIPGVTLYGDYAATDEKRVPVVSLNIEKLSSAETADFLWQEAAICVRSGMHCAPLVHEAMGTVEQGMVRFSFSDRNTDREIDVAAEELRTLATAVRS